MTSTTIKLKRSTTANSIPTTTSLASGEIALNTTDGKLFFKKTVSGTDSIVTLQPFPTGGNAGQYLSLDNSNSLIWINKPETTTYLADTISMPDNTKGTYNSGDVTSIQTFGDYNIGNYYSVNDTATAPGFIVDVTFTGVIQFNRIVMSLAYQVTSGHIVYVELYNYATSDWEILQQYSGLTNWAQFTIGVISSTPFIDNGNVLLRIYHSSTGNPSHETKLDYIALEDSTQGGQGPKGDKGATGATGGVGPSFRTIQVAGRANLVAVSDDTLTIAAGAGILLTTSNTAPKTLTITSTGGGGGGSSTSPLKTFNVLGTFGLLTGTARFYPVTDDIIQTVILSVGSVVGQDLVMALYRDGAFVQTFTIDSGTLYKKYSGLSIAVTSGESYTVNIISGGGTNLSMGLYNINL